MLNHYDVEYANHEGFMNTTALAALFTKSEYADPGHSQNSDLHTESLSSHTSDPLEIMDQWLEEFLQMFQI